MKYINRSIDEVARFYEDELKKAISYFEVSEDCETLEDVAEEWNREHAGDCIGELIVKEF